MPEHVHEYEEQPNGDLIENPDVEGPCCQECGDFPAQVVKEYKEYEDGSLEYVRDLEICCGCFGQDLRTWKEYKEYPSGELEFVYDTSACCDCFDDPRSNPIECMCCTFDEGPLAICIVMTFNRILVSQGSCACDTDTITTTATHFVPMVGIACHYVTNFIFCGVPYWLVIAPAIISTGTTVCEQWSFWISVNGQAGPYYRAGGANWNFLCGDDFALTDGLITLIDPNLSFGNGCLYLFDIEATAPGCTA